MSTKEELVKQVAQDAEVINGLRTTVDEQKATCIALRKELATAKEEAAMAKENLARALGYIDRINDQERPPVPPYQPPASPPTNVGPVMQQRATDQYGRYR